MITRSIKLESSSSENRIKKFLLTIYSFHKLTDKEMEILTQLIYHYQLIEQKYSTVKDPELFNRLLFDTQVTKQIKEKLHVSDPVFQNYMTTFRKKGVIVGRSINPRFLFPKEPFNLTFIFP
jgi:hypothetical protein